jgi:hypothetical protein
MDIVSTRLLVYEYCSRINSYRSAIVAVLVCRLQFAVWGVADAVLARGSTADGRLIFSDGGWTHLRWASQAYPFAVTSFNNMDCSDLF